MPIEKQELVANTHIAVGDWAGRKGQCQPNAHWHLQGSWLLASTPLAARSHRGCMAVEASDRGLARGMQVHIWRDWLQVSAVVQASDRRA